MVLARGRGWWLLVVVGLVLVGLLPPEVAGAAGPPECSQFALELGGDGGVDEFGGFQAIVFVHGIDSGREIWDEEVTSSSPDVRDLGMSMLEAVAQIEGIAAYTFDYHDDSLQWVDHENLGPKLVDGLVCLSDATGRPVMVVAHSMGGLVTRWAASQPDPNSGGVVGDRLGPVFTLGTPYEGSHVLTYATAILDGATTVAEIAAKLGITEPQAQLVVATRAAIALCGRAAGIDVDYCPIPGLKTPDSPAGEALRIDSVQLNGLPPWPASVAVYPIAGSIRAHITFFYANLGVVDLGDLAVSLESATATATASEPLTIVCQDDIETGILVAFGLAGAVVEGASILTQPCMHTNLPHEAPRDLRRL